MYSISERYTFFPRCSGFHPDQPISESHLKVFVPQMTVHMNTNEDVKFVLMSVKARGTANMQLSMCIAVVNLSVIYSNKNDFLFFCFFWMIENVVLSITVRSKVVHRNGNDYPIVNSISVSTELGYFKMDHKYQNVPSTISNIVSGAINLNWRLLKPLLDPIVNRFVSEMVGSILTPILDRIALQDFFDMKT